MMLMWFKILTLVSAGIGLLRSTLRQQGEDVMDGPLISPPPPTASSSLVDNYDPEAASSARRLWDLSCAIRDSIRLGLSADHPSRRSSRSGPSSFDGIDDHHDQELISLVSNETKLVAYAPRTFRRLRQQFAIDESEFRQSLLASGPLVSFASNSKGAGRVGGLFLFTRNGAYLIKTIKPDEAVTLRALLPRYVHYMQQNQQGRRSLLNRICGMYGVALDKTYDDGSPPLSGNHTVVILRSVFPVRAGKVITERYDLKGSTLGRECSAKERERKKQKAILKDLDWVREATALHRKGTPREPAAPAAFALDRRKRSALFSQLRADVTFLCEGGLMDYSLLVGVAAPGSLPHDDDYTSTTKGIASRQTLRWCMGFKQSWPVSLGRVARRMNGLYASTMGYRRGQSALYFFGLIDYLQEFNSKKQAEYLVKSLFLPKNEFSCVPPEVYASRFLEFLERYFL